MAQSLAVSLQVAVVDSATSSNAGSTTYRDLAPTNHDQVDPCPITKSTNGAVGSAFTPIGTTDMHVERIAGYIPPGADVILRLGGAPARVVGTVTASPGLSASDTLVLNVDGGGNVTATFDGTETTITAVARRINYYANAPVASVDPTTGGLALAGTRTGGQRPVSDSARQQGSVAVVSGNAVAKLGLAVSTTYGDGQDLRLGGGPVSFTCSPSALPSLVEFSGSVSGATLYLAGKAT